MPEVRLGKARGTLPVGYQFGDAGKDAAAEALHRNMRLLAFAARKIMQRYCPAWDEPVTANVIEGDQH